MPVKKEVTRNKKQVTSKNVKVSAKTEKVENEIRAGVAKPTARKSRLSVTVYSLLGRAAGTLDLPKEVFGVEVNQALLKQAVRVYSSNLKSHRSHTKTRGEVRGSTRKIYKQKGTGRARHGAITAPIFVGGGIALGPRARKVVLDLPDKMKKKALISALSQKMGDKKILGVSGLEKASGKTKEVAVFIKKIESKSVLLVIGEKQENAVRAAKNLTGLELISSNNVNAYDVLRYQTLILTKDAADKLAARLLADSLTRVNEKTRKLESEVK